MPRKAFLKRPAGCTPPACSTPQANSSACVRTWAATTAVDKLIGWAFMQRKLPLHDSILLVSGRASYEILQKSTVAGLPVVCAVSAPSHLAVDVARRFGVTLIGFLRGERLNVYAGAERILWNGQAPTKEFVSS